MDMTKTLHLLTSLQDIISNDENGKVLKVSTLNIFNKSTQAPALVNVEFVRAGQSYKILKEIKLGAEIGFGAFRSKDFCVYLETGDKIRLSADLSPAVEAVCSYEVLNSTLSGQSFVDYSAPRRPDRYSLRRGRIFVR